MNFGICPLSVVPLRSSSSDKSEMVSQLLFGEMIEYLEKKGSWRRVRCIWDNYIGWVDDHQIKPITHEEFERYSSQYAFSLELLQAAMGDGYYLPVTLGATLPNYDGIRFSLNGSSYTFSGQAIYPLEVKPTADLILKIARRYLYAPYLWGGRSPMGIDCSGFTQVIFKMVGINLARDAYQQVEHGQLIDFMEQAVAGDLAFFENNKKRITHVGIIMPEGQIIHASGRVRIDRIDHYGIFNEERQKYTHRLRVVKRVLPEVSKDNNSSHQSSTVASKQIDQIELF
ncbi:MAG: C40 family peptidase [Bacteroidota bacterium]